MKRRMLLMTSALFGTLGGCFQSTSDYMAWDTGYVVDADGDGFDADQDCDDGDATVNPIADEICDDGIDNDCDDLIDADDTEECG
jgi:hypothetical protein